MRIMTKQEPSHSDFIYEAAPQRVVFGTGTVATLAGEVARLGLRRPLVVSTPGGAKQAQRLVESLDGPSAGALAIAAMHTPVGITEAACREVAARDVDGLIAVGGGSAVGLAKAVALRTDLPQIAVPTTYAGSEMTDLIGETSDGEKKTRKSPRVRPEVVIYDVELTIALPVAIAASSAFNAMSHAVEAIYAPDGNPVVSLMAAEGIRALHAALPTIVARPGDQAARTEALYGAWLCGTCLGAVTMGLHHKLCHVLGGMFDLPHAETHTVLLPYVLAYNAPSIPDGLARLAVALDDGDPVSAFRALQRRCGTPTSLREIGFPADGVEKVVAAVSAATFANPHAILPDRLRDMLRNAEAGHDHGPL